MTNLARKNPWVLYALRWVVNFIIEKDKRYEEGRDESREESQLSSSSSRLQIDEWTEEVFLMHVCLDRDRHTDT